MNARSPWPALSAGRRVRTVGRPRTPELGRLSRRVAVYAATPGMRLIRSGWMLSPVTDDELAPARVAGKAEAANRWSAANAACSSAETDDEKAKAEVEFKAADDNMREVWAIRNAR